VCNPCHEQADREREAAQAAWHWESRLDGWAGKRYGEDWAWRGDADQIEEQFEAWLEQHEGVEGYGQ